MRKNLLAISAISLFFQANAQYLTTVSNNAKVNVRKSAYIHNGGGLKTIGSGQIENRGSINIVGQTSSKVSTLETDGSDKSYGSDNISDINIVNRINEPGNYAQWNKLNETPIYTYGQLKITGIPQANIKAFVSQEYRAPKHGAYQQIAFPFIDKEIRFMQSELGTGSINNTRGGQREVLYWDNKKVRFNSLPNLQTKLGTTTIPPHSYYALGTKDIPGDLIVKKGTNTQLVFRGIPVSAEGDVIVSLVDAGKDIDFGNQGQLFNYYQERYNSYLDDAFVRSTGVSWENPHFGRNIYQIGNPFLMNLDLRKLKPNDQEIYGIKLEPRDVKHTSQGGGSQSGTKTGSIKFLVFSKNGTLVGDTEYTIVRPGQTFVLKLKKNKAGNSLNLADLRTFSYNEDVALGGRSSYSSGSTVKQLAIIGLDKDNQEIGRTYYVLSDDTVSGTSDNATTQVGDISGARFGIFEEDPIKGGYDKNNIKMLYINEANESDFYGKAAVLGKYNPEIKNFKFEISENTVKLNDNEKVLSSGESFYFKNAKKNVIQIAHNMVIPADGNATQVYGLYYGNPTELETSETTDVLSKTYIAYNLEKDNYIIRFSKNWKSANIEIYDALGRLVSSDKNIKASEDYTINLNKKYAGVFFVKVISDKGELFQSKLLIK